MVIFGLVVSAGVSVVLEKLVQMGSIRLAGGQVGHIELVPWRAEIIVGGITENYVLALVDVIGIIAVIASLTVVSERFFKTDKIFWTVMWYAWLMRLFFYWIMLGSSPFVQDPGNEGQLFAHHLGFSLWVVFGFTLLCAPLVLRLVSWWTLRIVEVFRNWRWYVLASFWCIVVLLIVNFVTLPRSQESGSERSWRTDINTLFF
jgi:hypothetical protein